jgi:hypothetical protein
LSSHLDDKLDAPHEIVIHVRDATPDTPAVYQANCACGWHWTSRLYRDRAEADAATHMAAVQMFRDVRESRALARRANTRQRGS